MKAKFLSALMVFSPFMVADHAVMDGVGTVSREPDYVRVSFTVSSQCYQSPQDALNVNNGAVKDLQAILNRYVDKDSEIDGVFTNGGNTEPFSKSYTNEKGKYVTICQNTWKKETTVTLKLADVSGFSAIFAAIQSAVVAGFKPAPPENIEAFATWTTIEAPSAHVCEPTRREMEQEAYAKAMSHARGKFEACREATGLSGEARIASFGESVVGSSHTPKYAARAASEERAGGDVEISFEDLSVTAKVSVRFEWGEARRSSVKRSRVQ